MRARCVTTCLDCGAWVCVDVDTSRRPRVEIACRCQCPTDPPGEGDTR